ncbi:MAG: NRDE family protein [Chitinophagaceae bacterium]|nr:NRDE family protein [Chitinophagaceae bacterium]
MCTVSFLRVNESVIITSNRDEHRDRENSAAPAVYNHSGMKMIYPKDAKAGGTWFVAGEQGTVAVLLNGAFESHIARPPYRKSRGLILLEIAGANQPVLFFSEMNLNGIEPFTVVLFQSGELHELRWDGNARYNRKLNEYENHIWASATLYSPDVIEHRKKLFEQFIHSPMEITVSRVYDFHANNHGDDENGFIINRQTGMKTFSITQAIIDPETIAFTHADLLQDKQFAETMPVKRATIKS